MLIRFSVSNFLSFNEEVEFSMIGGKIRLLPSHMLKSESRNNPNLLKGAVIYGANASGKSNLIKAMEFAVELIEKGTPPNQAIRVKKFRLDKKANKKPSRFEFEFKIKKINYAYGFTVDNKRIHEEWLYRIGKTTEKVIFERKTVNDQDNITFDNIKYKDKEDEQFIEFVARGTRPNQLFLTESIERNVAQLKEVYDWFKNNWIFIFPHSRVQGIEFQIKKSEKLSEVYCEILSAFNTGISGIKTKEIDLENEATDIPRDLIDKIDKELIDEKEGVIIRSSLNDVYSIFRDEKGDLKALRLMAQHMGKNSSENSDDNVLFEMSEESDGTQRLIDLIPSLLEMSSENNVICIDEIDRSLHPAISKQFLEMFYEISKDNETQLILTTHESSLLDLELLRRDEIWFVEKNKFGESTLYSLEEFKPRFDKEIQKGYLLGRFGAIPILRSIDDLGWTK